MALGLFALIATAGFSLLSGVLNVQERTDGRLRRLSEIQRAVFVVTADLDQLSGRIDGSAERIEFQKWDLSGRPVLVRYDLQGGRLMRTVSGPFGERTQAVLGGVTALSWTYRHLQPSWDTIARPPEAPVQIGQPPVAPPPVTAVALDLGLIGPDGRPATLRRVVATSEVGS